MSTATDQEHSKGTPLDDAETIRLAELSPDQISGAVFHGLIQQRFEADPEQAKKVPYEGTGTTGIELRLKGSFDSSPCTIDLFVEDDGRVGARVEYETGIKEEYYELPDGTVRHDTLEKRGRKPRFRTDKRRPTWQNATLDQDGAQRFKAMLDAAYTERWR